MKARRADSASFRSRVLSGDAVLGGFVTWAEGGLVEMLALGGFDFAVLDCEHGFSGAAAVESVVRAADAADIAPIVRVPSPGSDQVGRVLDAGAAGILVPRCEDLEAARRASRAARYAPDGTRGLGAVRANRYGGEPLAGYVKRANAETLVVVQIETAGALAAVEEIAALPGVDVLFVGPNDLSQALGIPGDTANQRYGEALARIAAAAKSAGKAAGIMAGRRELLPELLELGYRFFTTSDRALLLESARAWRAAL